MPQMNARLFSEKVKEYVSSRPSYSGPSVDFIIKKCDITPTSIIVDIGTGTGKLAKLFLQKNIDIIGCEPNEEMRQKAIIELNEFGEHFKCLATCAEETTLKENSVDLILVANTLHLLDRNKTIEEFKRILKPGGNIAILYNIRNVEQNELAAEYETLLLKYSTEYQKFSTQFINEQYIPGFFDKPVKHIFTSPNPHPLTQAQFIERFYSSAWLSKQGFTEQDRKLFESEAKTIFRRCQLHQKEKNKILNINNNADDNEALNTLLYQTHVCLL